MDRQPSPYSESSLSAAQHLHGYLPAAVRAEAVANERRVLLVIREKLLALVAQAHRPGGAVTMSSPHAYASVCFTCTWRRRYVLVEEAAPAPVPGG